MELAKKMRPITVHEALKSYEDLKTYPCQDPGLSRAGIRALDYFFFHHRLKTETKAHISFFHAMKDPQLVDFLTQLVQRYKKKSPSEYTPEGLLNAQYGVFQLYYGTVNQFRPAAAKWVYCQLKPKVGILDFSSGWGGRALAAMSMGIPYYGFDANTKLKTSYKNMIDLYESKSIIEMNFMPSETVDFSKYKYDLVFTSPPYFMIEKYEKMPAYESKQNFLERFFSPVIERVWKHLLPGGYMALNMPEEMYDAIKGMLPNIHTKMLLPLHNRHPTNAALEQSLGKLDIERSEIIYVWRKRKYSQTRKFKRYNALKA
jgi:hypothetical protein